MEITRAKVEHLLKIGVWQESQKGNHGIEWKHFYMCGSNVAAHADTEEELTAILKKSDIPMFPKTIYHPPRRSRSNYFGNSGDLTNGSTERVDLTIDAESEDAFDQYELLSSATCIMPMMSVNCMPVETYDISPFEIAFVTAEDCLRQMLTLLMFMKRLHFHLPRELKNKIYIYLVNTSNRVSFVM